MIRITYVSYGSGDERPEVSFYDAELNSELPGFSQEDEIAAIIEGVFDALAKGELLDVYVGKKLAGRFAQ